MTARRTNDPGVRNRNGLMAVLVVAAACVDAGASPELVASLADGLSPSQSVVYCASLQASWDQFKGLVNCPAQMQKQDGWIQTLNEGHCPGGTIPEDACVALAGYSDQGIVSQIEATVHARFGDQAPALPACLTDKKTLMVTYSHLRRSLQLSRRYSRSATTCLRFSTEAGFKEVEFFGIPQMAADAYSSDVEVLHEAGEDEFALLLRTRHEDEFVVLSKMKPPASLKAGVQEIRGYLQDERVPNRLCGGDVLAVPIIEINSVTNHPELCERMFKVKGFEEAWLHQIYQDVQVRLDEKGYAAKGLPEGRAPGRGAAKSRRFLFDKPFLLTLWKKEAEQPYLAMWVASADGMVSFKGK